MKKMKILTVNGQSYEVCDPRAVHIDDEAVSADTAWSSQKLSGILGETEASLDSILAIQNELIGGGSV